MELNVTFIIQLAAFLFTVVLVSNVAFGPILKTLDDRHSKIEGAREEAARLSGTSGNNAGLIEKRLSEARTAGQEEMTSLKTAGEKLEADLTQKAREDAARKMEAAKQSIKAASDKARSELEGQAKALAESIANKALGRNA